jgi:D-serine deaminase-like pyridoxal phosphate-dependent protein
MDNLRLVTDIEKEWYFIENADKLNSPQLVFYPDRILQNIKTLKLSIDKIDRLRPHVKTHKSAELTLLMLQAGITKYKCATIAEAEMLGNCRAPDVLLAYQLVGPNIIRFIKLQQLFPGTRFSCLLDNLESLNALSDAAAEAGLTVAVYLDLNVGMNRTGVEPGTEALVLYQEILKKSNIDLKGIHAYDGHIQDASYELREQKWRYVWNAIAAFKGEILSHGLPEPIIIAGGTPTFPFYAAESDVECSPGTFILWDKGYQDAFSEQEYLTSALVITRVISLPGETKVSVDLGHKAVAAENELSKRVSFLNAPDAEVVSQSEEHLVLDMGENHGLKIGDVLYGLPVHICPTVALYDTACVVYDHHCNDQWKITSRNRTIMV